jgi:hypothetical protein
VSRHSVKRGCITYCSIAAFLNRLRRVKNVPEFCTYNTGVINRVLPSSSPKMKPGVIFGCDITPLRTLFYGTPQTVPSISLGRVSTRDHPDPRGADTSDRYDCVASQTQKSPGLGLRPVVVSTQ